MVFEPLRPLSVSPVARNCVRVRITEIGPPTATFQGVDTQPSTPYEKIAAIRKNRRADRLSRSTRELRDATKAIELMAENDSRDDVRTLYREAARTKTDDDRVIVERIDQLTQAISRAEQEIAQVRGQIREVAGRRTEIEQARREFRQRGYDYPGTTFGNDSTIHDVLGGILQGVMKGIVLGQVMQQGYRQPPSSSWGGSMRPPPMFPPSPSFPRSDGQPPGGGFRTGGTF